MAQLSMNNNATFLDSSRIVRWCIYALVAFPLIDYTLHLPHIHPIGVIWDKVVLLILAIVAYRRWRRGIRPKWLPWHKFAGFYIVFGLALMFAGLVHPIEAAEGYRTDVYYMLFAFLIPYVVEAADVPKLLHVAASIAILIGIHGIYQYVVKAPIPASWVDLGEHVRTRVFSVLTSPNELGSYMALNIPLIVGLFLYDKHRWRRIFYGVGLVFCLGTQLFTYDRGSLLALAAALFVTAILFERRLLIIIVLLGVVAFFIPSIHHRFTDLLSPVYFIKAAQGGRTVRWLTAFDNMLQNPLFGSGLGRYGGQVASDYGLSVYSDGYYAKILGESGLIGLVLFVSLHVALIRDFVRTGIRRMKGRNRYLMLGAFTGVLAIIFHNTVEHVFEFAPMAAMYFTLVSLYFIWARHQADIPLDDVAQTSEPRPGTVSTESHASA